MQNKCYTCFADMSPQARAWRRRRSGPIIAGLCDYRAEDSGIAAGKVLILPAKHSFAAYRRAKPEKCLDTDSKCLETDGKFFGSDSKSLESDG